MYFKSSAPYLKLSFWKVLESPEFFPRNFLNFLQNSHASQTNNCCILFDEHFIFFRIIIQKIFSHEFEINTLWFLKYPIQCLCDYVSTSLKSSAPLHPVDCISLFKFDRWFCDYVKALQLNVSIQKFNW